MKIKEFYEWAGEIGIINPVVEDEVVTGFKEKPFESEKTDRKIHTYVFPSGRVIGVLCDKEDTIVGVRGDGEIGLM